MSRTKHEEYKQRRDPYDPRTGATGNDDPNGSEADAKASRAHEERDDSLERPGQRSSPGSGEDKGRGAADIQPDDVEGDEPAR